MGSEAVCFCIVCKRSDYFVVCKKYGNILLHKKMEVAKSYCHGLNYLLLFFKIKNYTKRLLNNPVFTSVYIMLTTLSVVYLWTSWTRVIQVIPSNLCSKSFIFKLV